MGVGWGVQKNSGGGEDLIRGGDIFYLGGCTPPCTPPENPPMMSSNYECILGALIIMLGS